MLFIRNTARPFPFLMEKAAWICFRPIEGRAETESEYRSAGLQKRESIVNGGKPSKKFPVWNGSFAASTPN